MRSGAQACLDVTDLVFFPIFRASALPSGGPRRSPRT
jgi:hypothetical protein